LYVDPFGLVGLRWLLLYSCCLLDCYLVGYQDSLRLLFELRLRLFVTLLQVVVGCGSHLWFVTFTAFVYPCRCCCTLVALIYVYGCLLLFVVTFTFFAFDLHTLLRLVHVPDYLVVGFGCCCCLRFHLVTLLRDTRCYLVGWLLRLRLVGYLVYCLLLLPPCRPVVVVGSHTHTRLRLVWLYVVTFWLLVSTLTTRC